MFGVIGIFFWNQFIWKSYSNADIHNAISVNIARRQYLDNLKRDEKFKPILTIFLDRFSSRESPQKVRIIKVTKT
jgi:hypothetical protein